MASYQYGSIRGDDVGEALGARPDLGRQGGVARVVELRVLVVVGAAAAAACRTSGATA